MSRPNARTAIFFFMAALALTPGPTLDSLRAQSPAPASQAGAATPLPAILTHDKAVAVMPPSVFFRGQTASIQGRNSAGVRFPGDRLMLVAPVDTSGYSSGDAQRYQAYLLTEVPLRIEDQILPPGAYGLGFLDGNRMVVMDIGGNEILHGRTTHDEILKRPTPLQIVADPGGPGRYRLYLGRNFIRFAAAPAPHR
jgi:hypothetical protein